MNMRFNSKKIILGTAQLGSNYGIKKKIKNKEISNKILKAARRKNISYLDMAESYKESIKILKKQNLGNWKICFKVSDKFLKKTSKENNFIKYFFNSLKEFKIKNYEYFLFHNTKSFTTDHGKKIYNLLIQLKNEGYIKKIGVSLYSPKDINKKIQKFKIDVVQIPLNVFDQRFLKNNFLSKLKKKNIEIHARSIFLQGLLTLSFKSLPKKFNVFKNTIKNWELFFKANNSNAVKECLRFVFNIDQIDKIVVGVDDSKHLKDLFSTISRGNLHDFSKLESNNLKLIDPRKW